MTTIVLVSVLKPLLAKECRYLSFDIKWYSRRGRGNDLQWRFLSFSWFPGSVELSSSSCLFSDSFYRRFASETKGLISKHNDVAVKSPVC
uniref:Uncharacterized protein n=1 Tax=Gasterosteus aculeatus TaxID=69293 RepID=G3PUR6_GASAC